MKTRVFTVLSAVLLALCGQAFCGASAFADEPIGYAQGQKLMAKYHCDSCHAIDKTRAGPSLRDIAKKYASSPTAPIEVQARVLNGSTGVWGTVAMPPTAVPPDDLNVLVEWILSLH